MGTEYYLVNSDRKQVYDLGKHIDSHSLVDCTDVTDLRTRIRSIMDDWSPVEELDLDAYAEEIATGIVSTIGLLGLRAISDMGTGCKTLQTTL